MNSDCYTNNTDQIIVDGWVRLPRTGEDPDWIDDRYSFKNRDGQKVCLYQLTDEQILLPRSALSHIEADIDLRTNGRELPPFSFSEGFEYKEGQEQGVQQSLDKILTFEHDILQADPGIGKTVMGAAIAAKLGVSTCILFHKEFFFNQWRDAFRLVAPNFTVGVMQRDQCDTGREFDVVGAIVQSVVNKHREYPSEFYNSFGFLICDEVHRYGADVWQQAITKFPARYRLGLTATPGRPDGMWPIIKHHISPVGTKVVKDTIQPIIYQLETDVDLPKEWEPPKFWKEQHRRARIISFLAQHEGRNKVIVRNIIKAWKAKRKILVMSDRRSQLNFLDKEIRSMGIPKNEVGFYVGSRKQSVLDNEAKKQIIFATYSMANEGLDIPALDVLFFGTPRSTVLQVVGRILRELPGKKQPIVFDMVDVNIEILRLSGKARYNQYFKKGYEVVVK